MVFEAPQPVACGSISRYLPDSVHSLFGVSDARQKNALRDRMEGKLRNYGAF